MQNFIELPTKTAVNGWKHALCTAWINRWCSIYPLWQAVFPVFSNKLDLPWGQASTATSGSCLEASFVMLLACSKSLYVQYLLLYFITRQKFKKFSFKRLHLLKPLTLSAKYFLYLMLLLHRWLKKKTLPFCNKQVK